MTRHARSRTIPLSTLALATAIAGALATGAPAAAADMPVLEKECVYYELPYEQARPVVVFENDPNCPIAIAIHDAIAEAAAWPDFDPSDMTAEVAATNARLEAAAWPDYDPSDMTAEVAATDAEQEAADWPDFDSTAIDAEDTTDVAVNSPRMTQIAAEEDDGDTVVVARGNLRAF